MEEPLDFGPYALLDDLARGGMGDVYLAKSRTAAGFERLCVLKKIRGDLNTSREHINRFLDEARVAIHLAHPHICNIYDFGAVRNEYYLTMEYVAGVDLRQVQSVLARTEHVLPRELSFYIILRVLDALEYAHELDHPLTGNPLNLVHRDISPQNIMLGYQGDVKVIDFGLASSELKVERTDTEVIMGKLAYMAPEQLESTSHKPQIDVFSAGVLLYELLFQKRFYHELQTHEIWDALHTSNYQPKDLLELDPKLQKIVLRATASSPEDRFQSAREFREALQDLMLQGYPNASRATLRTYMQAHFAEQEASERSKLIAKNRKHRRGAVRNGIPDEFTLDPSPSQKPKQHVLKASSQYPTKLPQHNAFDAIDVTDRVRRKQKSFSGLQSLLVALVLLGFVVASVSLLTWLQKEKTSEQKSRVVHLQRKTQHEDVSSKNDWTSHIDNRNATQSQNRNELSDDPIRSPSEIPDTPHDLKSTQAADSLALPTPPVVREEKGPPQHNTNEISKANTDPNSARDLALQSPTSAQTQNTDLSTLKSRESGAEPPRDQETKKRVIVRRSKSRTSTNPNVSPNTQKNHDAKKENLKISERSQVIGKLKKCDDACAKLLVRTLSRNSQAPIPKAARYTIDACLETCQL